MSYEKLTSDKVNYLIWRYLQEAGFGQTAARLQVDWGLQHHPDDLFFAKHIGPRSLIKLMHYGLKLHRIQTSDKPNAARFFGPDPDSMAITETITTASTTSTTTATTNFRPKSSSPSRRLEVGNQASSSSSSAPSTISKPRNRRGNGATSSNANGKPKGTGESMDVDQPTATIDTTQDNDMDVDENDVQKRRTVDDPGSSVSSPIRNGEPQQNLTNGMDRDVHGSNHQNQEQQPIPIPLPVPTLINGTSIGIQSDKVIELAPTTKVLNNNSIKGSILSHAEWSPSHAKSFTQPLLAIGGKQLGQIWEINKVESENIAQATDVSATSHPSLNHVVTLDVGAGHTLVSLAWSPDGDRLAYSMFSDNIGGPQRSIIRTRLRSTGEDGDTFSTVSDAVTNLAWNETGRFIAGISSTSLLIFDTKSGTQFRPLDVEHTLLDITWIDKETLAVCGDFYIAIASVSGMDINVTHVFTDIAGSTEWSIIRYDVQLNSIAVASDATGELAVIQANLKYHKEARAHESPVVDMVYQPVSHAGTDQARILVTSSTDGSVKVWNTRSGIMLEQALEMGGITQALKLAFSPDGNLLAVADWDKVLIWDIRHSTQPKFKWELRRVNWQSSPNGHTSNGINHVHDIPMDETDEDAPILKWAGPRNCLTFAYKDKVALIDVPS